MRKTDKQDLLRNLHASYPMVSSKEWAKILGVPLQEYYLWCKGEGSEDTRILNLVWLLIYVPPKDRKGLSIALQGGNIEVIYALVDLILMLEKNPLANCLQTALKKSRVALQKARSKRQ